MADSDPSRPRKRAAAKKSVPRTPDAVEIALEYADADAAEALLAKHTELIDAQIKTEKLEHGSKRLAIAGRFLLALAGIIVAVSFLWLVISARRDRGLVIEAFATPPDLAARGMSGEVLAGNLADRLADIDRQAASFRSPETMSTNWGDDIKIVIPSTGVSVSELDHFLRAKLGRETVIGGSVFRTPAGLRLTVRTGSLGTVEQTGNDNNLEPMIQKAAEGVFRETQAYRYSKYLEFSGRMDEAMQVARDLAATTIDPKERAWAWAQISNLLDRQGDLPQAAEAGKRAISEDPGNALAWLNTGLALAQYGHGRDAVVYLNRASVLGADPSGGLSEVGINTSKQNLALIPSASGDFKTTLDSLEKINGPTYVGGKEWQAATRAQMLLAMHDVSASRAAAHPPPDTYFVAHFAQTGALSTPQHAEAVERGDWQAALRDVDAMLAVIDTAPEGQKIAETVRQRHLLPLKATDLAAAGRLDEARAIAAALPQDCDNCAFARLVVALLSRDYRAADLYYADVRKWNPDGPFIPTVVGAILDRQGLHWSALRMANEALKSGPNYADALKLKGDALRKIGKLDEAADYYSKAAARAPRWGRLQIDWAVAEIRRDKLDEAREHLDSAATMDLNPADSKLLERLRKHIA